MSWVLPLVGCGGPAVSRCGHETRRHRVRGVLFASVFASVLLAACGGGSGGNLTTSSEPEPGPPGPGSLTATGDGGNESEEEQQQKTIVNQEEENEEIIDTIIEQPEEEESEEEEQQQQKIVVNIQQEEDQNQDQGQESEPESEEEQQQQKIVVNQEDQGQGQESESESENDQESDDNNNEETPQQLTIIEEPPYIPPAKEEPRYSASTGSSSTTRQPDCMTVCHDVGNPNEGILSGDYIFSYGIWLSHNDPSKNALHFLRDHWGNSRLYTSLFGGADGSFNERNFAPTGIAAYQTASEKTITARYYKKNGFQGNYLYGGRYGRISGDVDFRAEFDATEDSEAITVNGSLGNNITMGGYNFENIEITGFAVDYGTGTGKSTSIFLGSYDPDTNLPSVNSITPSSASIEAMFTDQLTFDPIIRTTTKSGVTTTHKIHLPNRIVGEVKLGRFRHTDDTTSTASKNALYGVFVGEVNGRTPKW